MAVIIDGKKLAQEIREDLKINKNLFYMKNY